MIKNLILRAIVDFFLGAFKEFMSARRAKEQGRLEERERQQEEIDDIREEWDEIDNAPADIDDALGRLRERSKATTKTAGDPPDSKGSSPTRS